VCYSNLNVKLAPTHSGITVGPDGGSHQMLEDIALMRVLPGMRVLVPADYHAACGAMVANALEAAEILASGGISAEIIDVSTVKPLDKDTIVSSARKTRAVVVCEEHSIIGGLGSAIAEILSEESPVPMKRVGIRDVFGTSGDPDELMEYFGLTSRHILEAARVLLGKRSGLKIC